MSWLVPIVGLFYASGLATNQLPIEVRGQTQTAYWTVGISGAALFFVSLLAHEVGHALVARREGIGVEGISLWLLGGLAKLEHEAENAGAELRIAVVGPLTSAAVGLVFLFMHQALSGSSGLQALFGSLFGWLGFINLLLAAFNLLPGAPLDGGRVLTALLWMRTRNQTAAQVAGARVGQVLGAGLLALGVFLLQGDDGRNGIWVLVVGVYILVSATSELRSTAALGLLRDIRVREIMDPDPPVLPEWMMVSDLVANAAAYLPHTAFATRSIDGKVTGLVTAEAIQAADPRSWSLLRLADLAFPVDRLLVAGVDDSVLVTMQRARTGVTGRVLVLRPDGRIAGLVGPDITARAAAIQHNRRPVAATVPGPLPPLPPSRDPWDQSSPPTAHSSGPPSAWPTR